MGDEERFLELVLGDPTVTGVLDRARGLELPDAWLTAGVLFQAVWNRLTGRPPGTGVRDADLFYFSDDLSWEAEDVVIRRATTVFADAPVPVEVRNEARVHLWYAEHFGSPAPRPFTDCRDAVDHFAAVCCRLSRRGPARACEGWGARGSFDCSGWWSGRTPSWRRSTCTRRRRRGGRRSGPSSRCCPGGDRRRGGGAWVALPG